MNDDNGENVAGLALMSALPAERRDCPVADAMSVLGERWTILVVRELFYGAHRFDRIVAFTGGSRDLVAARLRTLEEHGIVEKRRYSEHPPRYEYHLTESGRDLLPVILTLAQWGQKWVRTEDSGRHFVHDCGHVLRIDTVCESCGRPLDADAITPDFVTKGIS